ncbi:MAG: hypothetical protein OHK0023_16050 [Anaerolineae bacterium]
MLELPNEAAFQNPLGWDATYEIVLALMQQFPSADLDQVGLHQLKSMILGLPNFADDPALAHDDLLADILREWWEETHADF